jgi:hypothetical protein
MREMAYAALLKSETRDLGDLTGSTDRQSAARSRLDQKKKAGGLYAADLVLQLPARVSGSVAIGAAGAKTPTLTRLVAPSSD